MTSKLTGREMVVSASDMELYKQELEEAQVNFLLQRTPKSEIKQRQGRGGMMYDYVEHGYVTDQLNKIFGFNWDFEIVDKQVLEDEVMVEARLTVRTPKGARIVKTQFGGADIKCHASGPKVGRPLSIADDYKAAGSDALKKCASLLGIGLDLYGRDRVDDDSTPQQEEPIRIQAPRPQTQPGYNQGTTGVQPEYRRNPPVVTPDEQDDFDKLESPKSYRATEQQVKAIYAIGKSNRKLTDVEVDALCRKHYAVGPYELSTVNASEFITTLQRKGDAVQTASQLTPTPKPQVAAKKSDHPEAHVWDEFLARITAMLRKKGCADHLIQRTATYIYQDLEARNQQYDQNSLDDVYGELYALVTAQQVLQYAEGVKNRLAAKVG